MRKFIKKATAFIIVASMTLASVSAFASPSIEIEVVPLRAVVENAGGTAEWDSENARIIVTFGDDVFIFRMSTRSAYLNSEAINLQFPIITSNDRAYISAADAAYFFPLSAAPLSEIAENDEPVAVEAGEFDTSVATAGAVAVQMMEALSIPGVTVAIVDAQTGFTWTGGFGYADTTTSRPVDGSTLFQIASTSKPFTAIAVMQLAERGLLDIDAPIINYLPEFSQLPNPLYGGDYSQITARMLLSNTSGITVDRLHGWASLNAHYQGAMNDLLDFFAGSYMTVPANSYYVYENAGWTLLGILVARISGYDNYFEGFISYTEENIFAPLGMNMSSFEQTADMFPYLAMFYNLEGTQDPIHFTNVLGAGSVVSNANEMAIFMQMILNGGTYNGVQILTEASVNQMLALHDFDFSTSPVGYGLGFLHRTGADGFQTVGHGGTLIHHHTEMVFNREAGIGVFVSTNSASALPAAGIMGNAILQTAIMEKTGAVPLLPAVADADAVPLELSAEELAKYEGLYLVALEMWMIAAVDGMLILSLVGTDITLELVPMSDGSFDSLMGRVWFEEAGGEMGVIVGDAKALVLGARADINAFMANDSFEQWIGTYTHVIPEGHASVLIRSRFFVNELGMAVVQSYNAHGLNPITPLTYYNGTWFMEVFPINFEVDEDGNASYEWLGGRFVRE